MKRLLLFIVLGVAIACTPQPETQRLLIGTYTDATSQGIYRTEFNPQTGKLSEAKLIIEVDNPSYIALDKPKALLYAVSEGGDDESSALNAYRYDATTDSYTLLSRRATMGASPCYVALHDGYAYTANYTGGSLSRFKIASDGSLGDAEEIEYEPRQGSASHIHGIFTAPDLSSIYVTDLGRGEIFQMADGRELSRTSLQMGTGPRHMAFAQDGKVAYALNELSGTVAVFDIGEQGLLLKQTIASDSVGGGGCADIHLSPDGRYLYTSNRLKEDGISTFKVAEDGTLEKIFYTRTGRHPRNFTLSPDGRFLLVAVRYDNCIEVYSRNSETGELLFTGEKLELSHPVCLKWID